MPEIAEFPAEALQAWACLGSRSAGGIEIIHKSDKTSVYRLFDASPGGRAIIAKRCEAEAARVERILYENVLPELRLSSLEYHGFVDEGACCWLFLEDSEGEEYAPDNRFHRETAARFLARLHASAAREAGSFDLPDRGANYYLGCLLSARSNIFKELVNPAFSGEHLSVLETVLHQLDAIETRWEDLARVPTGSGVTLVPGDLQEKNVHLRGDRLLVLDWEHAGWGSPAPDIAFADEQAYFHAARELWPRLSLDSVRGLAAAGKAFRWVAAVLWTSMSIGCECPEFAMSDMRCYAAEMESLLPQLDGVR